MRKLRLGVVAALATAAVLVPSSSATAEDFVVVCPDKYYPMLAAAAPEKDRNDNAFVCVKGPQGHNGHFNVKDDKGETVPPTSWDVTGYGSFLVWYVPNFVFGSLEPTPEDIVDDGVL